MILNRQRAVRVARQPLESFLRKVQDEMDLQGTDVTICLVSDAEISRMNEAFRKKKGPTDVLSFPTEKKCGASARRRKKTYTEFAKVTEDAEQSLGKPDEKADKYLGDIAIAPETARRYAKKHGRSLSDEMRVLILHGVLHLLGYDHETDRGEMDRIEQKMRRRFGLA
ncbi:MAG TPA: rRNA maturation RNase YbeY [Candidatus Acidoferrum sp.]